ncbi:protein TOO MANY MOUTHS-like [Olea europaea var. sylvestris]|uniref:protein TOO MANY MOUTHS-like n=1 Tax=Olea europaea var. sylvestris TaxID=158386 RepID=UPI000C1D2783|nr:protein TOO MANY MOUTHS-like [Olea europaea var. sylvestris]
MCRSFSFFSLPLVISFLLIISSVSTNRNASENHPDKNLFPSDMNPLELETLFKIMKSVSSDKNWRSSHPNPCNPGSSWLGIECKTGIDNHFHVTRLDFGTPPNPTCKNTATFPSEIFELPNLESIFIFQCFAHTQTAISFPKNKISISSLQQLSLRENSALIGSIPPQISSLKSLQILTLSQNMLTGLIPVELFSLNSLLHLDLSYNRLTGTIPVQISNLRSLLGLDLKLLVLQKLDFSSNSLTGSIPDSFQLLNSLIFLALSNNKLHGRFPRGLTGLQNLQYFIMDDNPMFIPLPLEFGHLRKLQELRLANSGYSGTIPPIYSQLTNLSALSLQNNRLTGKISTAFGNLSHIYHLNLSRNFLGGVVPFNSSFLKRLGRNLDLSSNPGLCLSPSEAFGVNVGIDVCGSNKTASSIRPLKNSESPFQCPKPIILTSFWVFLALHHILFSV